MEKTLDHPVPIPRLNPSHLIQTRQGLNQKNVIRRKETLALVLGNADTSTLNFLLFRDIYTIRYDNIHTGIFFADISAHFNMTTRFIFCWRNPAPL